MQRQLEELAEPGASGTACGLVVSGQFARVTAATLLTPYGTSTWPLPRYRVGTQCLSLCRIPHTRMTDASCQAHSAAAIP